MSWDYELYITEKLNEIKISKNYDIDLQISSEQAFAKIKDFKPNTIYVVLKYLSSTYSYNVLSQPVQIMAISEQNQIDITKDILSTFTNSYNWVSVVDSTTYIKQQYSTPVVLSNFNEVGFGYRSLVYITGTLEIMDDLIDVSSISIDSVTYKPIAFSLSYQMTGNTQPVGTSKIAVTQKNISTLNFTMVVSFVNDNLCSKVLGIINETTNGNDGFSFVVTFSNSTTITTTMKLINAKIDTSPNQPPSLNLSFMR